MTERQRQMAREKSARYRARHRDRLLAERRTKSRKPCPDCGQPKPEGRPGCHRCPECEVAHRQAQLLRRAEERRKVCRECGGPKPSGVGRVRCDDCERIYVDAQSGRTRIARGRKYVYRYRVIMEERLGRPLLPTEHVHHVNGDPSDDRPENLTVLSQEEHGRLHGYQSGEVRLARKAAA